MPKKITIKDLIDFGFLKVNEEIYMDFRGFHFTGRIREGGKIETLHGIFKSPSRPAYLNMRSDADFCVWRDGKIAEKKNAMISGWHYWKTWNDTPLDHLRKKLVGLINNPESPTGTNIGIWQNHSDRLGEMRFYWGIKSEVEPRRKEQIKNYFRIVLPHTKNNCDDIKNLMSKNFEVFDIEGNESKQKLFDVDDYGIEAIIESNYNNFESLTLEEFFRFIKKRSDQWSKCLEM